jgi:hypothetical protein
MLPKLAAADARLVLAVQLAEYLILLLMLQPEEMQPIKQ